MSFIHPTAIIESGAQLHESVRVDPYAIIGKNVQLGPHCHVGHHASVQGFTRMGEGNEIHSFAAVGHPPQDLKYKGEATELIIGDHNIFREYTTIQPGTVQGGGKTEIGSKNLFMAYVHVAHDCVIGNENIFANGTQLAGHVTIHNKVFCGGLSAIHQFCVMGDYAMMSAGTIATKDVPPYCLCDGKNTLRGMNIVAMQRGGLSSKVRDAIKEVYKILFLKSHLSPEDAEKLLPESVRDFSEVQYFLDFVRNSKRSVCRPGKSS